MIDNNSSIQSQAKCSLIFDEETFMRLTLRDFVEASLYPNEEAVLQEALQLLLQAHPEMKIELAIVRYQQESLSLEDAAGVAGVSWGQMKNILVERSIPLRFKTERFLQKEKSFRA